MDALKLPVRVLQASVPGLRLRQGALTQVQVVFVEEALQGCAAARVVAGPCKANASLAAGGSVG
jgi:ribosomal protein S28E/S33